MALRRVSEFFGLLLVLMDGNFEWTVNVVRNICGEVRLAGLIGRRIL